MQERKIRLNLLEQFDESFRELFSRPRDGNVLSARINFESKHAFNIMGEYRQLKGPQYRPRSYMEMLADFARERNCTNEEAMRVAYWLGRFTQSIGIRLVHMNPEAFEE